MVLVHDRKNTEGLTETISCIDLFAYCIHFVIISAPDYKQNSKVAMKSIS